MRWSNTFIFLSLTCLGHIASMFLLPTVWLAEFFHHWITTQIHEPFICCQEAMIFDLTLKVFTYHLMCDGQVRIYFVQLEIATCNLCNPNRQRYKILQPLLSRFAGGSNYLNIHMTICCYILCLHWSLKDLPIMPLTLVQKSEVASATPKHVVV